MHDTCDKSPSPSVNAALLYAVVDTTEAGIGGGLRAPLTHPDVENRSPISRYSEAAAGENPRTWPEVWTGERRSCFLVGA